MGRARADPRRPVRVPAAGSRRFPARGIWPEPVLQRVPDNTNARPSKTIPIPISSRKSG